MSADNNKNDKSLSEQLSVQNEKMLTDKKSAAIKHQNEIFFHELCYLILTEKIIIHNQTIKFIKDMEQLALDEVNKLTSQQQAEDLASNIADYNNLLSSVENNVSIISEEFALRFETIIKNLLDQISRIDQYIAHIDSKLSILNKEKNDLRVALANIINSELIDNYDKDDLYSKFLKEFTNKLLNIKDDISFDDISSLAKNIASDFIKNEMGSLKLSSNTGQNDKHDVNKQLERRSTIEALISKFIKDIAKTPAAANIVDRARQNSLEREKYKCEKSHYQKAKSYSQLLCMRKFSLGGNSLIH